MEATILENQMEKKMENEMETGITYYRTLLVPLTVLGLIFVMSLGHLWRNLSF